MVKLFFGFINKKGGSMTKIARFFVLFGFLSFVLVNTCFADSGNIGGYVSKNTSSTLTKTKEKLRSFNQDERAAAASRLGKMGQEASSATEGLIALLSDGSDDIRMRVAVALGEIKDLPRCA
jgi:hypothetical protein